MQLARQQDPELFSRVEREHRNGNLEQMRTKYVKQVNQEIAVKNREHGIESRQIDINELANRDRPIAKTSNENPIRMRQKESDIPSPNTRSEQPPQRSSSEQSSSRIKKESKSESKDRPGSADNSDGRAERTSTQDKRVPSPQVRQSSDRGEDEARVPERGNEKSEKQKPAEKKSTQQPERQNERRPSESRQPVYNRSNASEGER